MELQNTISPYVRLMRLHQPVGIWLLMWPCWWGLALAGERQIAVYALFALGAVVMRAAGCIINDMCDRGFDAQVERTKHRPLASGELSMPQATVLLILLLVVGCGIALLLGHAVLWWSAAALPLVAAYPLMKRITWWPQLFLGLTFNWGALVGWVSVKETIAPSALLLYVACVFWTLGYDTLYAHQDKKDDQRIGVRSTALRLGSSTKFFVGLCYSIFAAILCALVYPGKWGLVLMAATFLHLMWQVRVVDLDSAASCRKIFASNRLLGGLVFLAIYLTT